VLALTLVLVLAFVAAVFYMVHMVAYWPTPRG
jgi:hypothetical protein